jgi:hypothetical protein
VEVAGRLFPALQMLLVFLFPSPLLPLVLPPIAAALASSP